MVKFCDKCGAQLKTENARFCDKCGAKVSLADFILFEWIGNGICWRCCEGCGIFCCINTHYFCSRLIFPQLDLIFDKYHNMGCWIDFNLSGSQ